MQLFRCKECGSFPAISTGYQYFNEMYKAQVRCKCSNNGEVFVSTDSKTCVEEAVENWNEYYGVHPKQWDFTRSDLSRLY